MNEFDTALKRAFAEAHEPIDDGFSVQVGQAVARREVAGRVRGVVHSVGVGVAIAALGYGAYALASTYGQDLAASAGLEFARAYGAVSETAPTVSSQAQGWMQSLSAGLTQVMLIVAMLAGGGAVAYRVAQD